jgi:undecaprenyl-diphosphatase
MKSALLVGAVWLTYFLKETIKDYVCRPRPENVCSGFSFPSGHCSIAMCFYGILIYLVFRYVHERFWRYFLITLFSVWIFMVGISRMWLGAHFLTDVIAGMFLGFFVVNLYIIVNKLISR